MINRLKYLRKNILNLKQSEFANKINLKQNSYSNIENEKVGLNDRNIASICSIFNVNENWLRNGTEPIFLDKENNTLSAFEELKKEYKLDDLSSTLLSTYLNLDDNSKDAINNFLKTSITNYYENHKDEFKKLDSNNKVPNIAKVKAIAFEEGIVDVEVDVDKFNEFLRNEEVKKKK